MALLETPSWLRSAADPRPPEAPLPRDSRLRPEPETRDSGDMGPLEVSLLRRSLAGLADTSERCGHCARTMLIGERVYEYRTGAVLCELCRDSERQSPAQSHTVHGPEFGHTIRVLDRRAV